MNPKIKIKKITQGETVSERASLNNKHYSFTSVCGTPPEFYVRNEEDTQWVCQICNTLKQRNCNKCGMLFWPGCRIRFVCIPCFVNNSGKYSLSYGIAKTSNRNRSE